MECAEQYEIWICTQDDRWEFAAAFVDLDLANAVAGARQRRVRVVHTTYEGSRRASEEVLAEIGSVRQS